MFRPRLSVEGVGKPHGQDFKASDVRRHEDDRTAALDRRADEALALGIDPDLRHDLFGLAIPHPKALHGLSAGIAADAAVEPLVKEPGLPQVRFGLLAGFPRKAKGQAAEKGSERLQEPQGQTGQQGEKTLHALSVSIVQTEYFTPATSESSPPTAGFHANEQLCWNFPFEKRMMRKFAELTRQLAGRI